jgi:hypothetical protein
MPGLPELDIARVRRWCQQRVPLTPKTKSASNAKSDSGT